MMLPFQRGFQRIVKGRDVPIIPVFLDRVWGSNLLAGRRPLLHESPGQDPLSRDQFR